MEEWQKNEIVLLFKTLNQLQSEVIFNVIEMRYRDWSEIDLWIHKHSQKNYNRNVIWESSLPDHEQ